MHDVTNLDAIRKKQRDKERHMFLRNVIGDEQKTLARLALAGIIFDSYQLAHDGYVEVSIPDAARKAKMGRSIMYEAFDWLRSQRYLIPKPGTNRKNCYVLGPGPMSATPDTDLSATPDSRNRSSHGTNR